MPWSTFASLLLACPVCFQADGARRTAYVGTTWLLSLFPLAMFAAAGVVALALVRRARKQSRSPSEH